MKWPSIRFFLAIGLLVFSLGVYNTLSNDSKVGMDKMEKMDKKLEKICDVVEKVANEQAKGSDKVAKEITEGLWNKVFKNTDNTVVKDSIENARSEIVELIRIQEKVVEIIEQIKIEKDNYYL